MRIIVLGGSGFIGSHILERVITQHHAFGTFFSNPHIPVAGCGFERMDIRDFDSVLKVLAKTKPDMVVQVSGTQNIEYCAANPQEALQIHAEGTRNVVRACQEVGIRRLVYISTDCVFDGENDFFSEDALTHPFNVYGHVKLAGENAVLDSGLDPLVIRASILFGWRKPGQASNFALRVWSALTEGYTIPAATNLFNTPLEITPATDVITRLSLGQYQGIYHVAGRSRISRYEFAIAVAEIFGLNTSLVLPVSDITKLRQPNSCLAVNKVESLLNIHLETLQDGLHRMAKQNPQH